MENWIPDLEAAIGAAASLDSVEAWKGHVEDQLSAQPCVFHRNAEITALYGALYLRHPGLFKWAGMAAHASHHVRVALWPLRLSANKSGFVDLPKALGRWQSLRISDVDQLRQTNNSIFKDVYWAHLVYDGSAEGLERLEKLAKDDPEAERLMEPFRLLEEGRLSAQAGTAGGEEMIWEANRLLLRHEQEDVVQPNFDQLSCAFARAFSFGATLGFQADGPLRSLGFFTSFYGHSLTGRLTTFLREFRLPMITKLDDRWDWIERSILPRFRRYEGSGEAIESAIQTFLVDAGVTEEVACSIAAV